MRISKRGMGWTVGGVLVLTVLAVRSALGQPDLIAAPSPSLDLAQATRTLSVEAPAAIVHDDGRDELVILHGPVNLPPASGHGHDAHQSQEAVFPPVADVRIPFDADVFGFYVDLVDRDGERLPDQLLHHVNLVDPERRELFAPIAMRVAAAGNETGYKSVPPRLIGLPFHEGQRIAIHTMLHNGTEQAYEGVVLRFHLRIVSDDAPDPFVRVFPFWVDVQLPAGDKTFDLPPGDFSKSYEAQPAVRGRILALSGHAHRYAIGLRFEDVTAGRVLWEGVPELDPEGNVTGVPIGSQFLHLGDPVDPQHTYRLTVDYHNPEAETLVDAGMGSIGGVFLPSDGKAWPKVDRSLELYQLDIRHYYRELMGKLDDLRATVAAEVPEKG